MTHRQLFITILLSTLFPVLIFAQKVNVCSGKIKRHANFSSEYVQKRNVDVWLPEGYSKKNKYAVIYMHDGQMLFDSTNTWNKQEWKVDETLTKLLDANKIQNVIIVGIWNNRQFRHAEYFPEQVFRNIQSKAEQGGERAHLYSNALSLFQEEILSDEYLKFIVEELKPFIDKKYSTKREANSTFMAGSSMGGMISLYGLCKYPETFGGVACLSTHWPGVLVSEEDIVANEIISYFDQQLPSPGTHKIYMDIGSMTLDSVYEPYQVKINRVMEKRGYDNSTWISKIFEGAEHSERSWGARLDEPMVFLLGR